MSPQPRAPSDRVWDAPNNLGFADQLRGLGGTVAPVLAGFSLAAIATLQTADSGPPLEEWCLVAFSASAVFLLMTMQLSSRALSRSATPATRLEWEPLALLKASYLHAVRARQALDMQETRVAWRRAGLCYDLGLNAFLAGVVMLLVPEFWSVERVSAVGGLESLWRSS